MALAAPIVPPPPAGQPLPGALPNAAPWLATWMHVRAWAACNDDALRVVAGFRASVEGPFGGQRPTLDDAVERYVEVSGARSLLPDIG